MLFWFPFGFIFPFLPILLIIIGVRVLLRLFRNISREFDDSYDIPRRIGRRFRYRIGNSSSLVSKRLTGREAQLFQLAFRMKGRITLSDVVIETGLDMREAEDLINKMVDGVRVTMEVDDHGHVLYEFPEIITRFENDDTQGPQ